MVKRDPSIDWQQLEKVEGSPSLPSSDEELKDENPTVELVGLKYDYYKSGASGDTVTGTLFVKSISKEALAMDFDERGLLVKFHTKNTNTEFLKQHGASEETTFTWRVNVKEAIRPEDCRCRLSPCKLELVLKKKVPSRWSSLELAPPAKKIEKWPGGIESSDKRDICNFNRFYEFISDYIFKHIWWLHHFWRVRNVV
ncbi:ubiquitin carboxyl-terminal hydrolase 19 isoform X5 [Rhipicephalus sanguineus]|uniref:ubiquitin carboxyl-terminal hydrolase 19 isoform X5 n=1 Tax=Rhipicephalus sanguineus TaxID=34632 RepID=UPI0018948550|nr:ubiquitin carboxyl-terminal hydrolase 19 isoform X5 [Rhipicephalus sanguineus]XP_037529963.1 ubiquitin carboxyl-terminal hydrolase 19 isoform X5 [Rhipicephalus sanguineus]